MEEEGGVVNENMASERERAPEPIRRPCRRHLGAQLPAQFYYSLAAILLLATRTHSGAPVIFMLGKLSIVLDFSYCSRGIPCGGHVIPSLSFAVLLYWWLFD